ncbi:MAG: hypothetical protein AB7I25_09945, partial [Vicinamibacterales bacterium]
LVRAAVATVADGYLSHLDTHRVIEWFDLGGSLQLADTTPAADVVAAAAQVQGLIELTAHAGIPADAPEPLLAAGVDFILEGLYALKKISRSDERGFHAGETPVRKPTRPTPADDAGDTPPQGSSKKRYYN